jgi:hypothetical protein
MSVSPCSSFLRQRSSAGRFVVAPDNPRSLKTVDIRPFSEPRVAGRGSGRRSRRGVAVFHALHFDPDI